MPELLEARDPLTALDVDGTAEVDHEKDWLDALFEESWAYFMASDYPHALGNIHTIESPYFPNSFYPEAQFLKAIIYFTNCQYENAKIIEKILAGGGPKGARAAIVLNAAAAVYVSGRVDSYEDGVSAANEALTSGKAKEVLENLRRAYTRDTEAKA